MIVLDTNVVSEVLKPRPDPLVIDWLDRQAKLNLFLATISLADLLLGVELLAEGRRKRDLQAALNGILDRLFGARILPFDARCAVIYAEIVSQACRRGNAIRTQDGQIAATAKTSALAVATRDRRPFEAAGLKVIDPWAGQT